MNVIDGGIMRFIVSLRCTQTLDFPRLNRPGLLLDHLRDLQSSATAKIYNKEIANGGSKLFGCSGQDINLNLATSGGHIQTWNYLYQRDGKQYFIGGISARKGGQIFIVKKNNHSDNGCIIWSKIMGKKGGDGLRHNNIWGYWDHPSQISVVGQDASFMFVAITVNCYLDNCAEEDEGGVIFINVDDPSKPYRYPTQFVSDEWVEPDVLDITKIDNKWILGIANAKGSNDPDSSRNKMWTYHSDKFNYDDPGASWQAPANAIKANALLHGDTQFCRYITAEHETTPGTKVFWLCTGGHSHKAKVKSNFFWGSEVNSAGLPINTAATYIDHTEVEPNGEIPLNQGDYNSEYCFFRGGASISLDSHGSTIAIDCSAWKLGETMGHVRMVLKDPAKNQQGN